MATSVAAYKPPFHVDCVVGASGAVNARNRFFGNHGPNMLVTFLQEAGLDYGTWVFRIQESFRVSGRTPPIQVRRPVINGVSLWLKPGDNGSGVKGILLVTKDKNKTPEEVYKILDTMLKKERSQVADSNCVDHIDLDIDDLTMVLLLEAVDEVVTAGLFQSMNTFVDKVARKMAKDDVNVAHWLEVMEHAVCQGLLEDKKTHYLITKKGLEFVAHSDENEHDLTEPEPQPEKEYESQYEPHEENIVPITPTIPHAYGNGNRNGNHYPPRPAAAITASPPRAAYQPPAPVPQVLPVITPMTHVVAPALSAADSLDPVAVLIANQKKFADMSKLIDTVANNRALQAKCLKSIADLRHELEKLKAAEAEITRGVDLNAMAAFFQK